tara:strand:- start:694 stop:2817 length:2124 start_codon:yes stop_codon:yes gene_type:complete
LPGWKYLLGFYFPATFLISQSYNWPCEPFNQQHWINGTFCECRSGTSGDIDHFHDGVDIHLPQGNAVYSVIDGTVTSIGTSSSYGYNSWVRVGRYCYVHVDPNPALTVGEDITAYQTILGWTNSGNHIHFKDGYPGNEINALRTNGGLEPFTDTYDPTVHDIHFYTDGLEMEFNNNQIFGMIDIVCRTTDHTDDGPYGNNNGILTIGYEVMDSLGMIVFGPVYPFSFTTIPPSDSYIQYVYAPGSNTSNYRYIVSNNLYSNHSINVTNWSPGNYTFKVVAMDQSMNKDSLLHTIEIVAPDIYPPDPPVIVSILPKDNGFDLEWLPNNEPDLAGYRLYFSYDAISWNSNHNESILINNMTLFEAESFSASTGYFKMTAIDNAQIPNESQPSNIVVFRQGLSGQNLIIINSFEDQDEMPSPPYTGNIGLLSDRHGVGIVTVNDTLFKLDSSFTIPTGHLPIILRGNNTKPWDQDLIESLENLSFWILGGRAAQSLSLTLGGTEFLENYLGISFAGLIPIPSEISGIQDPYIDFYSTNLTPYTSMDSISHIDLILNESSTYPILADSIGNIIGIAVSDPPSILSSIPLELLDGNSRSDYFDHAFGFLLDTVMTTIDPKLIPEQTLISFYPNPFNSQGIITLNTNPGNYNLSLFNILGTVLWEQKVKFSEKNNFSLRLPRFLSNRMSSGPYIIVLIGPDNTVISKKILYIK